MWHESFSLSVSLERVLLINFCVVSVSHGLRMEGACVLTNRAWIWQSGWKGCWGFPIEPLPRSHRSAQTARSAAGHKFTATFFSWASLGTLLRLLVNLQVVSDAVREAKGDEIRWGGTCGAFWRAQGKFYATCCCGTSAVFFLKPRQLE